MILFIGEATSFSCRLQEDRIPPQFKDCEKLNDLPSIVNEDGKTSISCSLVAVFSVSLSSLFTLLAAIDFSFGTIDATAPDFPPEWFDGNKSDSWMFLDDFVSYSDPSHPLHSPYFNDHSPNVTIRFGWTGRDISCHADLPVGVALPSILRLMELHCTGQYLLRSTFLASLLLKPLVTFARCRGIRQRLWRPSTPLPFFLDFLLTSSPALHWALIVTGSLCTLWHSEVDFASIHCLPFHLFSLLFVLHGLVYTLLGSVVQEGKALNIPYPMKWPLQLSARFLLRFLLIGVFAFCAPRTLHSYSSFLQRRICHGLVPVGEAVVEYLTLSSIASFSTLE